MHPKAYSYSHVIATAAATAYPPPLACSFVNPSYVGDGSGGETYAEMSPAVTVAGETYDDMSAVEAATYGPNPASRKGPHEARPVANTYSEINPAETNVDAVGYEVMGQDCYAAIAPGMQPELAAGSADGQSDGSQYLQLESVAAVYSSDTAPDAELEC